MIKKPGWQKTGFLGGEKSWLAADFEADVADGLLVGEMGGLVVFFKALTVIARGGGQELTYWFFRQAPRGNL